MRTLETHLDEANVSNEIKHALLTIGHVCAEISTMIRQGALAGVHGEAGTDNVQGEQQKKLDVIANDRFVQALTRNKVVCGLASEEMDHSIDVPGGARILAAFDPLDGSSNIDVNVSIGSIFSLLPAPKNQSGTQGGDPKADAPVSDHDFLKPGHQQLAAGYAIYGPSTELVITVGRGVYCFTLDSQWKTWVQTKGPVRISDQTLEFAINASNSRHWYPAVQRYIKELLEGETGPRGKNFNMRWVASMVADVHRILCRGGIFLYPADQREPDKPGKLRLLYEANPMSLLVTQAGGLASNTAEDILAIQPTALHQRVAVALGAKDEVRHLGGLHQSHP